MNLIEFTKLTLHNANEAKSFMNFMLGYAFTNKVQSEQAILGLFESFPEEYKKENKLFEPIFYKFFQKFSVNEGNIKYYDRYIKKQVYRTSIMTNNPTWHWGSIVLEYNSLAALLAGFDSVINAANMNKNLNAQKVGWQFFKDHEIELKKFIKPNKNKAIDYLLNKSVFKFLLEGSYENSKVFCKQFDLDYNQVLKKITEEKGLFNLFKYHKIQLEEFTDFLQDIQKNKEYLIETNEIFKNNKPNIGLIFMTAILNKEIEKASILLNYLRPEIMSNLSAEIGDKFITKLDMNTFEEVIKTYKYLYRNNLEYIQYDTSQNLSDKYENFLYVQNKIEQYRELKTYLPIKQEIIKKKKI